MGPPPPLSSKPSMVSSSPGRAEKLPTPGFSHLLRGKSGSRSRSQTSLSRSSPLFPSRNPSHGRAAPPSIDAANDGEPSSPKVTCIGQVRIRKKNKNSASFRFDSKTNRTKSEQKQRGEREMRCCFINKSLLLSVFRSRQSIWRKWSVKLRFKANAGYRRGKERVESVPLPLNDLGEIVFRKSELGDEEEEAEEYDESETRVFVPPQNALILMRCRSAPHNRSSSLATRFSAAGDDEDVVKGEDHKAMKGTESSCEEEEDDEEARCPSSRPLFLKRSNSEPARLVAPEASRCSQIGDEGGRRQPKSPSRLH